MISGFEDITNLLSQEEKILASLILGHFKLRYNDKNNFIKGPEVVRKMREKGYNITEIRLRKIMNFLRQLGEPIIGSSKGYYYSSDKKEIAKQVISLEERAAAIIAATKGLKKYLNNAA